MVFGVERPKNLRLPFKETHEECFLKCKHEVCGHDLKMCVEAHDDIRWWHVRQVQAYGVMAFQKMGEGELRGIKGLKAIRTDISIFSILCSIMQAKLGLLARRLTNTLSCSMTYDLVGG